MSMFDHKAEREQDVSKIKTSASLKKVVVAGPGTGKSFLFQELIKAKMAEGKSDFVAITFIGKLGDALADDLCGLAKTMTMHGFARKLVLGQRKGWEYYPKIHNIIKEDLKREGVHEFKIGDENYARKSELYKAVGDADVVEYALKICELDESLIPVHDLILVDEFQDFNEVEAAFVDLLAKKNEMVIVGDDDQALYEFKGSSPSFIRKKYDPSNIDFESHTLRFCSRCTEVIIKYFHAIVGKYKLNEPSKKRIQKEYICYTPDKERDSKANPKICLIKGCPPGMIAYKIHESLKGMAQEQKIKEVLVIGEGRSCKTILRDCARQLRDKGYKNVDFNGAEDLLPVDQETVDAYKFIGKDEESILGWRILGNPKKKKERDKHLKNAKTLCMIIEGNPSEIKALSEKSVVALEAALSKEEMPDAALRKKILVQEIKNRNISLPRPLGNLNITVCNILNSKGLGADVVFLIGFDEGKFPSATDPTDSEIYQMLVALTRAKKRIYLINTIGKKVSAFIGALDESDLDTEVIKGSKGT